MATEELSSKQNQGSLLLHREVSQRARFQTLISSTDKLSVRNNKCKEAEQAKKGVLLVFFLFAQTMLPVPEGELQRDFT